MSIPRSSRVRTLLLLGGMALSWNPVGCGSSNPNEHEFLTAPPGMPPDHPNESFAERRERTRNLTKQELAAEAKNKAAEAKKAAGSDA